MQDIIHRPVFYLKHNIAETLFCIRLQVIAIQEDLIYRDSPFLRQDFSHFCPCRSSLITMSYDNGAL
jgi:hypothetical protein